jgi:hypothetical protein
MNRLTSIACRSATSARGKNWIALLLATTVCLLSLGCEAPNVFRNVSPSRPHAVLTSENPPGFRGFFGQGRAVSPSYINRHPTPFWWVNDRLLIAPGSTTIDVIDSAPPYQYEPMRFFAQAGYRYILRPGHADGRDKVTVLERPPSMTRERIVASAFRERE